GGNQRMERAKGRPEQRVTVFWSRHRASQSCERVRIVLTCTLCDNADVVPDQLFFPRLEGGASMSIRTNKRQAVSPSSAQARASDGAEVPPVGQPLAQDESAPQYPLAIDEVPDYRTPPPKRVFLVGVRYRYLGPGQSLT